MGMDTTIGLMCNNNHTSTRECGSRHRAICKWNNAQEKLQQENKTMDEEKKDMTLDCTKCGKVKHLNEFHNADLCNDCAPPALGMYEVGNNYKNGAEQEVNSIVLLCGNLEKNCGYHKGKECELDLRCKHQLHEDEVHESRIEHEKSARPQ
jgi:hypothetical protein